MQSCPDTRPATGGLELAGGRRFRVHEAFGHSASHVVYELEDAGVLFTGDLK